MVLELLLVVCIGYVLPYLARRVLHSEDQMKLPTTQFIYLDWR
jgi:hypothetical protein